jgi:hypothetical protein
VDFEGLFVDLVFSWGGQWFGVVSCSVSRSVSSDDSASFLLGEIFRGKLTDDRLRVFGARGA